MSGMNGAQALIRTLTGAGVEVCFSQPGHVGDALRGRAGRGPADARRCCACSRAWRPARRTGTGGWPGGRRPRCCTSGPGLANGLANLHNARRGRTPAGQRGRRPRDLPQAARRAAGVRHRRAGPAGVAAGCGARCAPPTWRPTPPRPWRRPARRPGAVATLILPADVSWSGRRRAGPGRCRARAGRAGTGRGDRRRRQGAAQRRAVPDPARRDRAAAARAARRPAGSPRHRARGCWRETFPARLERGAGPARPCRLAVPGRDGGGPAGGHPAPDPGRGPAPVSFFAYPGKPSSLVPGRLRGAHAGRAGRGRRRARWRRWRGSAGADACRRRRGRPPGPGCRTAP